MLSEDKYKTYKCYSIKLQCFFYTIHKVILLDFYLKLYICFSGLSASATEKSNEVQYLLHFLTSLVNYI